MREHGRDRAAVLLVQALDDDEALLDLVEALRIVAHRLAERRQRARRFLQAIERVLQLAGDRTEVGDLVGERLDEVQRARELRHGGVLVVVDERKRAGGGFDDLARVREDVIGFRGKSDTPGSALRNRGQLNQSFGAFVNAQPENACTFRVGECSELAEANREGRPTRG